MGFFDKKIFFYVLPQNFVFLFVTFVFTNWLILGKKNFFDPRNHSTAKSFYHFVDFYSM